MKKDWKSPTMTRLSVSKTSSGIKQNKTEAKNCPNGTKYHAKSRNTSCS